MASTECFTSFTFSYLSRALILLRTLREVHPEWIIWALVVDEPPSHAAKDLLCEFDHVLYAKELELDRFYAWLFKHDIVEACTAVKGRMLQRLLRSGASRVIYFDPDIAVFARLDTVLSALDNFSIVLTPHQLDPNVSEGLVRDNELTSLKYGVFNLGFLAVRNDSTALRFADWWARQLYFACYDEIPNGIFTDQKWCDLVPALFEQVLVSRDPGLNVASWNISRRRLSFDDSGSILVNGFPLKFYHFTKVNSEGDLMTEKYAGDNLEVMEVWSWYKRLLRGIDVLGIPDGYWHFGNFSNGLRIPKAARILLRSRADLFAYFDNPFAAEGDSYYNWLARERPDLVLGG